MDKIPLGQDTQYPKVFDPYLLFAIPRGQARESLPAFKELADESALPFCGFDEWTLYEICWRDNQGCIEMAIGILRVPCDSFYIVESKSLKLYINSLYYHVFQSADELAKQVSSDLNICLNAEVEFCLHALDQVPPNLYISATETAYYKSLDNYYVDIRSKGSNQSLALPTIKFEKEDSSEAVYQYKTERFRSLCPVTAQPDWATIYIIIMGVKVDEVTLAQYLVSFSEHQGFHENCVERIYTEIQQQLSPEGLSVAARYTRRGGIDINPIRASSAELLIMPNREVRQ